MKKLLLLLLVCSVAEAKPEFRLHMKIIGNDTLYIPQIKKQTPGYLAKQWVDISNQPLHNKELALQIINEARIVEETIINTRIINIKIN